MKIEDRRKGRHTTALHMLIKGQAFETECAGEQEVFIVTDTPKKIWKSCKVNAVNLDSGERVVFSEDRQVTLLEATVVIDD